MQHGESICNLFGKIGGDSELSERGQQVRIGVRDLLCFEMISVIVQFAKALKEFMDEQKMHGFNVSSYSNSFAGFSLRTVGEGQTW